MNLLALSGWALLSFLGYQLFSALLQRRRQWAEARRAGCKPAVKLPRWDPIGTRLIRLVTRANEEFREPDWWLEQSESVNHATYRGRLLGTPFYSTSDPKLIQAILATQFRDFGLSDGRRGPFYPLLGDGIFTTDGKFWEHSRALLRPQFAREQVSDLDLEERHVQNLMRALPVTDGWTAKTDLQPLFFRLTLDSACEFLLGESADSQLGALAEKGSVTGQRENDFARAFDASQLYLLKRLRVAGIHWIFNSAEFRQQCRTVHQFVDYFVAKALAQDPEKLGSNEPNSHYVVLNALAQEVRDPIELRSQLLNILLAGRDTTASLLSWSFYHLARHPDAYAKLREAVLAAFGTSNETITFAGLKGCAYLQQVLSETLRTNPVVPINGRRAVRDTTLPRGGGPDGNSPLYVAKGTDVFYSVHTMHHRKDLWGADADEWKPERWTGRRPGWEYLPFNGGPRICIGQQFALTEAGYVAARLVQRFDRIEPTEFGPMKNFLTLTSSSGIGVQVRLHEASAGT